jgi:hypothetical protein
VEENGGDGGGDGDVPPARAVIEGGRQNRERGYAVEKDRDSEPKEGHSNGSPAAKPANLQYIGSDVANGLMDSWDCSSIRGMRVTSLELATNRAFRDELSGQGDDRRWWSQ